MRCVKKTYLPFIWTAAALALASCNQKPDNSTQVQALEERIRQLEDQEKQLQLQAEKDKLASERAALDAERQKFLNQKESASKSAPVRETISTKSAGRNRSDVIDEDAGYREEAVPEGETYDVFYDRLRDDGRWYNDDTYGYVFQPDVAEREDWRPYTDGHWAYTDRGYTWVSNENFGWATYHYGRWVRVRGTGWVWVPGRKWAPAWVSWRKSEPREDVSDDYIGWAPLPPECDDDSAPATVDAWSDNYYGVGPTAYVFLKTTNFGHDNYREAVLPQRENVSVINRTTNITNITINDREVNNHGPQFDELNRVNNNRLQRYQLEYEAEKQPGARYKTVAEGNRLQVFAPSARLKAVATATPKVVRTIQNAQVDRGWEDMDPNQQQQLRQQLQSQAPPPPKTLPSKPVAPPKPKIIPTVTRRSDPPKDHSAEAQRAIIEAEKARLEKEKRELVKAGESRPPAPETPDKSQDQKREDRENKRREAETQKPPQPPQATAQPPAAIPAQPGEKKPKSSPQSSTQEQQEVAEPKKEVPADIHRASPQLKLPEKKPVQAEKPKPEVQKAPIIDPQQDARKAAAEHKQEVEATRIQTEKRLRELAPKASTLPQRSELSEETKRDRPSGEDGRDARKQDPKARQSDERQQLQERQQLLDSDQRPGRQKPAERELPEIIAPDRPQRENRPDMDAPPPRVEQPPAERDQGLRDDRATRHIQQNDKQGDLPEKSRPEKKQPKEKDRDSKFPPSGPPDEQH
ncbi:MAG TPA: DUF6600 domain-containing protein [Chthoniobacterales bacterium]